MEKIWDYIVIGAGLGGLSAASLLAKDGNSVLVLEKGTSAGGCASSFQKAGFIFESGATTVVGFEKDLPLDRLEKELGISFERVPLSIPMKIHLGNEIISRYQNKNEWIAECIRVFGKPIRQKYFWKFTFFISDLVWSLSKRFTYFPFTRLYDLLLTLRNVRPLDFFGLILCFFTTKQVLFLFGLSKDKNFRKFIDEQLMITNQSSSENAPFFYASAGLTYSNLQNYYIPSGIVSISNKLIEYLQQNNGSYEPKSEVLRFEAINEKFNYANWKLETKNKKYIAKNIISNVPIWNLFKLSDGKFNENQLKTEIFEKNSYGAFTMGIALKDNIPETECLHHQIHLEIKLPYGGGDSIFVSLSQAQDTMRSPNGIRILSISTHIQSPENWQRRNIEYHKNKEEIAQLIINELDSKISWFQKDKIRFVHTASPATWETWTGRKNGRVGGIPSSFFRNPFNYFGSFSKVPHLYLTGDTVYPGQGIPAVVIGGMNLAIRLRS